MCYKSVLFTYSPRGIDFCEWFEVWVGIIIFHSATALKQHLCHTLCMWVRICFRTFSSVPWVSLPSMDLTHVLVPVALSKADLSLSCFVVTINLVIFGPFYFYVTCIIRSLIVTLKMVWLFIRNGFVNKVKSDIFIILPICIYFCLSTYLGLL